MIPMFYTVVPYDRIRADLAEAIRWYERVLGESVSDTRLAEIAEAVRKISLLLADPDTRNSVFDRVGKVVAYYAWTDAFAFVRIWRGLSPLPDHLLPRQLLRRAMQGALSPADEALRDSDARNVFVQLEFAADLALKGIPPLAFGDLEFDFAGVRYIAECKRPWSSSLDAVARNLEKANAQLRAALRDSKSQLSRGLLVLVIDRIAKLSDRLPLQNLVTDESDVLKLTHDLTTAFWEGYGDLFQDLDGRIVATVIIAPLLVFTLSDATPGVVYGPTFISRVATSTRDHGRLDALIDFLNKQKRQGIDLP